MDTPINVLVLCTGNSCRSILAEAYLNHIGSGQFHAYSAGSHPTGQVNPRSLETLERHGISIEGLHSKSCNDLTDVSFDLVITVCDNAAGEACPLYLSKAPKIHWGAPDPAHFPGSDEAVTAEFERVFAMLREPLDALASLPVAELQEKEFAQVVKSISPPSGHDAEPLARHI